MDKPLVIDKQFRFGCVEPRPVFGANAKGIDATLPRGFSGGGSGSLSAAFISTVFIPSIG